MIEQREIGGRAVSAIGLGGAAWSLAEVPNVAGAERTLEVALDMGVTYIDTAAAYTTATESSHNERLIARVLRRSRHKEVLVGTKGGHYRDGGRWGIDGRPEAIRMDCDRSLAALGVDAIGLYYLHHPDPDVPIEESIGAIDDLRREGKVQLVGASNLTADLLRRALTAADVSALQNPLSPFDTRGLDLVRWCELRGIAFVIYSPLGGRDRMMSLAQALPNAVRLAVRAGVSLESLVLAWELSLSSSTIPIVGASRIETLMDSLSALGAEFDDEAAAVVAGDVARLARSVAAAH